MTDYTAQILARLKDKPGAIAAEIGATPVEMIRMEKASPPLVQRVGKRRIPGKRGRPPVEWAVTGAPAPEAKDDNNGLESWAGLTFTDEQVRILTYLDAQLAMMQAGTRVDDDGGDERLLRQRRKEIIREAKRRNA